MLYFDDYFKTLDFRIFGMKIIIKKNFILESFSSTEKYAPYLEQICLYTLFKYSVLTNVQRLNYLTFTKSEIVCVQNVNH